MGFPFQNFWLDEETKKKRTTNHGDDDGRRVYYLPRLAVLELNPKFYQDIPEFSFSNHHHHHHPHLPADDEEDENRECDRFFNNVLHRRLLNARYDVFSSTSPYPSYYGGDIHSWKKYVADDAETPVELIVDVCDQDEGVVEAHLTKPLKENTWYAMILLNTAHNIGRNCPHLYEDYIVPFKTSSSS
jgi:hypothetical protein